MLITHKSLGGKLTRYAVCCNDVMGPPAGLYHSGSSCVNNDRTRLVWHKSSREALTAWETYARLVQS